MLHKHSDYEDQKRNSQIQPTKLSPTRAGLLGVSVRMNREGRGSNEVAREAPDQVGRNGGDPSL